MFLKYFFSNLEENSMALTPAIDIFAFGMCALETAALELTTAGEDGSSKVKVSKKNNS